METVLQFSQLTKTSNILFDSRKTLNNNTTALPQLD